MYKRQDGDRLKKSLKLLGVNTEGLIRSEDRPTIVKRRILGGNQQLLRIDWEDPTNINGILEETILSNLKANIENIDAIILSDYDKVFLQKEWQKKL